MLAPHTISTDTQFWQKLRFRTEPTTRNTLSTKLFPPQCSPLRDWECSHTMKLPVESWGIWFPWGEVSLWGMPRIVQVRSKEQPDEMLAIGQLSFTHSIPYWTLWIYVVTTCFWARVVDNECCTLLDWTTLGPLVWLLVECTKELIKGVKLTESIPPIIYNESTFPFSIIPNVKLMRKFQQAST